MTSRNPVTVYYDLEEENLNYRKLSKKCIAFFVEYLRLEIQIFSLSFCYMVAKSMKDNMYID